MDLNFHDDPNLVPRPREEIRILELTASPYPDGKRVRVEIVTTTFGPQDRPNLELMIENSEGSVVATASIVEATQSAMALTMHLTGGDMPPHRDYILRALLFFEAGVSQHVLECKFGLVESVDGEEDPS